MADNEIEKISQAIKLTQRLRASVTKVFTNLTDGFHTSPSTEKVLFAHLQKSLLAVHDNFSDLEKIAPSIQSTHPPNLNTAGLLNLDPSTDKTSLGPQLHNAQKWTNKVNKYADFAYSTLNNNMLKRSQQITSQVSTKRLHKQPPVIHSFPSNQVDQLVMALDRIWPDMTIVPSRPMGESTVLQITVAKTLRAVIVLRGLLIEYVCIKAYNEEFFNEDGKGQGSKVKVTASTERYEKEFDQLCIHIMDMIQTQLEGVLRVDIWSKSRYQVFNKVTDLVTAATIHFYHPQWPDLSLRSFLHWLTLYKTLFSAPCVKCGRHLQGTLPPVWRDTRLSSPLHEECRQ